MLQLSTNTTNSSLKHDFISFPHHWNNVLSPERNFTISITCHTSFPCLHFSHEGISPYLQLHFPWFLSPAIDYRQKLLHEDYRNKQLICITFHAIWCEIEFHVDFFVSCPCCIWYSPIHLSAHVNHQTTVTGS